MCLMEPTSETAQWHNV